MSSSFQLTPTLLPISYVPLTDIEKALLPTIKTMRIDNGYQQLDNNDIGISWSTKYIPMDIFPLSSVIYYTAISETATTKKTLIANTSLSEFFKLIDDLVSSYKEATYDDIKDKIYILLNNNDFSSIFKRILTSKIINTIETMQPISKLYVDLNEIKVQIINAPMINPIVKLANIAFNDNLKKLQLSYRLLLENKAIDVFDIKHLVLQSDIDSIVYLKRVKTEILHNIDKPLKGVLVPIGSIRYIFTKKG